MGTLVRDRVTWLVYGSMAVYGYFLYGFGPTVSLVGSDQGVSRAVAGLHGTALAVGAVLAGLGGPLLVGRLGRAVALRVGLLGLGVGTIVYLGGTTTWVTLSGALIAGTFGSIVVNTHSAVLTHQHELLGPAAVSEANALAAGCGLLAPVVIGAAAAVGLGWRAGLLVAAVAALALAAVALRIPFPRPSGSARAGPGRWRAAAMPQRYWAAWTVLVLCIGTEFSLTFWSSDLLREQVGVSAAVGTSSVAALVAGMTAGRFVGGWWARRRSPDWLLVRSLLLAAAGWLAFWSSAVLWLSLLGLLVLGLGLSVQFPLAISRVIAASEGRPDTATGLASIGAGFAIGTAPFLLGFLADAGGTHRAFLLVPGLLGLALVALLAGRERTRSAGRQ